MLADNSQKDSGMAVKEYAGGRNGSKYTPVLVAVIAAAVGSLGTVSIYLGTPFGQESVRPDPYTGAQAATLTERLLHLEREVNAHIVRHPDEVNQFDRRITTLEVQYANIISGQHRIIERLDKMNGQ